MFVLTGILVPQMRTLLEEMYLPPQKFWDSKNGLILDKLSDDYIESPNSRKPKKWPLQANKARSIIKENKNYLKESPEELIIRFTRTAGLHDFNFDTAIITRQMNSEETEECNDLEEIRSIVTEEDAYDRLDLRDASKPTIFEFTYDEISEYYVRRIEDLRNPYYILRYFLMLVFILQRNDEGKEIKRERTTQTVWLSGEDETAILPSELLAIPDYTRPNDISDIELVDDALYNLKRLYTFGKLYSRVHIPSFVKAYYIAYTKWKESSSTGELYVNNLYNTNEIYMLTRDNKAESIPMKSSTKSERVKNVFNWLYDKEGPFASYLVSMYDLFKDFAALGLDIANEDMRVYDDDFFNSITIKKITPDNVYMPIIATKIGQNLPLKDFNLEDPLKEMISIYHNLYDRSITIEQFRDNAWLVNDYGMHKKMKLAINRINYYINTVQDTYDRFNWYQFDTVPYDEFNFQENLAYCEDNLFVFRDSNIFRDHSDPNNTYILLTDVGLFIGANTATLQRNEIYYINPDDLCDILGDYIDPTDPTTAGAVVSKSFLNRWRVLK